MDSEDEWAEENGEDLNSRKDKEEEDEDEAMNSDDQVEGFIVSDGHLSVSEYNFSGDEDDHKLKSEIEQRRARLK